MNEIPNRKITNSCLLKCLENPRFSGILTGLDLAGDVAMPIPKEFKCCSGSALRLAADSSVVRCGLTQRLQTVQELLRNFEANWGRQWLPAVHGLPLATGHVQWLANYTAGHDLKGRCLEGLREPPRPGAVWAVALAAAWRFGLRAHVVTMGATKPAGFFPKEPKPDDQRRLVFFVERVDKLWVPERAFDFETLVSWCDRSAVPLWIEVLSDEKKADRHQAPSHGLASQFSRKIEDLKNKAPFSWLQRDCASRLDAVTDGAIKYRQQLNPRGQNIHGTQR